MFRVHIDEDICACVRLNRHAKLNAESAEDLRDCHMGKNCEFKIPRHVVFRDDFRTTESDIIQKFKLKEVLEKNENLILILFFFF